MHLCRSLRRLTAFGDHKIDGGVAGNLALPIRRLTDNDPGRYGFTEFLRNGSGRRKFGAFQCLSRMILCCTDQIGDYQQARAEAAEHCDFLFRLDRMAGERSLLVDLVLRHGVAVIAARAFHEREMLLLRNPLGIVERFTDQVRDLDIIRRLHELRQVPGQADHTQNSDHEHDRCRDAQHRNWFSPASLIIPHIRSVLHLLLLEHQHSGTFLIQLLGSGRN